ncbi:MAG TPA: YraN family protein [Candidatus Limnocylindrales bacterium]
MAGARTAQQQAGDDAERAVADRLVAVGWQILGHHVRVGRGELDLLALDPGPPAMLVVIEVRWRHDRGFGLPEETFDRRKRAHLRRAVGRLIAAGVLPDGSPLPGLPLRVDLVAVEPPVRVGGAVRLRHHRSALED